MLKKPSVLAIITARKGSKGIPGKNIKTLAGKPLIAWTIEQALSSHMISKVIVSTDCKTIASVSKRYGADVPFMRPSSLAKDNSPHIDVVIHAVEWLESMRNEVFDYVMLLQPTSPLRNVRDINDSIKLALKKKADAVIGVKRISLPLRYLKNVDKKGTLKNSFNMGEKYSHRGSSPYTYYENGAIYIIRRKTLFAKKTLYTRNTFAYLMPEERSIDIDTPWDFYTADLILKEKIRKEKAR
jgi:N-acylneuraminate cytidylyltransferase/CMP-N,N'-diacetyllegionaminic acid synthase